MAKATGLQNYKIIMSYYAGNSATVQLAGENYDALTAYYTQDFIDGSNALTSYLTIEEQIEVVNSFTDGHIAVIVKAGANGIYEALWELSQLLDCGLCVELPLIPIRQVTIEVCEFLDTNPYLLDATGCILTVTDQEDALIELMGRQGIPAVVIGRITNNHDKIIRNHENIQYITPQ